MDYRKTIQALKTIFEQCGTDALQDRRRFEAYLEDLLPGSACSTERLVLRHALDSSALTLLLRTPAFTEDAARRAVEQLHQESRMSVEDAEYVVRCVIAAQGGNPAVVNRPAPKPEPRPAPQPQPAPTPPPQPRPDPMQPAPTPQPAPQPSPKPLQTAPAPTPAPRKKKSAWPGLAILVFLVLAVGGAYMVSQFGGSGDAPWNDIHADPTGREIPEETWLSMVPDEDTGGSDMEDDDSGTTDIDGGYTYIDQETGNTSGNISNLGLAVEQNGRVFYSDVQDGCMCVLEPDGQAFIMVEQPCYYLNVVGDWIYYCDNEIGDIYRIHTDGTGNELFAMGEYSHILATEDWVYCVGVIEEVRGTDPLLMRLFTEAGDMSISEALDLGMIQTLAPCRRTGFALADGWIYFVSDDSGEERYLCGMRVDGGDIYTLPDAYVSNYGNGIQALADWIYYDTFDDDFYDCLCCVRLDGSDMESARIDALCSETVTNPFAFELSRYNIFNYGVYTEIIDNEKVVAGVQPYTSIWLYGENGTELIGQGICCPNIVGDYLYFIFEDEENGDFLCREPLAGGDVELLPVK